MRMLLTQSSKASAYQNWKNRKNRPLSDVVRGLFFLFFVWNRGMLCVHEGLFKNKIYDKILSQKERHVNNSDI